MIPESLQMKMISRDKKHGSFDACSYLWMNRPFGFQVSVGLFYKWFKNFIVAKYFYIITVAQHSIYCRLQRRAIFYTQITFLFLEVGLPKGLHVSK